MSEIRGLRFLQRYWKALNFTSANEIASIDLPRTYHIHQILLRLSGTLTIGTAAATALKNRNPLGLIKKIRLIANGKDVIKSFTGDVLYEKNYIDYGTDGQLTATGLTVAAHAFAAELVLDLAMPERRAKVPIDSALDAKTLSSLDLEITWGQASDIVTPDATTTLTLSNTKIEVSLVESFGIPNGSPLLLYKEYPIKRTVSATSTAFEIDKLPVGNFYRGILLKTTDAGVRESDIINQIDLKAGEEVILSLKDEQVRDMVKRKYSIDSLPAGVYYLDFAHYGSIGDLLNLQNVNDLKLVLDVTVGSGTTEIETSIEEVIIPVVSK